MESEKPPIKHILTKNSYYLITGLIVFVISFFVFLFYSPNYNNTGKKVEFYLNKGMTLNSVADSLHKKSVIPSVLSFKISAYLQGAEENIKAGAYEFPDGISYMSLVKLLTKGAPQLQVLVTIPEGIWQHKLAGLLQKNLGLDSVKIMQLSYDKSFLRSLGVDSDSLEGYLLPETYYFEKDITEKEILARLNKEMDKLFTPLAEKQMKKLGMSKHQILTMASIIDGESNIESEFKKIAGVYYNRIKAGMLLQADPTVQYLLRYKERHNRILYKDLEINSPYNTYMYGGLPPTPINNPGKKAVLAALYPEEHDYYYFVADGTGAHKFAKTLSEHNRNVQAYRIWRRNQ